MSGAAGEPVDLSDLQGDGPVWGIASDDLNATLLCWGPRDGVTEHVNADLDVLVVVTAGTGLAIVDGRERPLRAGHALLVRKGARREIQAGPDGLRYLSIHRRRGPLQLEPLDARS